MLPADERLEPNDGSGGQLDDRLVMDAQFDPLERPA